MSSFTNPSSDTLIGYIRDYNNTPNKHIMNRIYFFYDRNEKRFHVRGSGKNIINGQLVKTTKKIENDFSFCCDTTHHLCEFIKFTCDVRALFTYELFVAPDLPTDSNSITFDMLQEYRDEYIHLSAYDDCKFDNEKIYNLISMTKHMYNDYDLPFNMEDDYTDDYDY